MSRLVYFVYDIVPYQESTTLQPCRTAAAVGNTIYVRVACPRYAAASCLCRSLSFVIPPHHTFLLYIRTFKSSNYLDRPTNPSLHIYVYRGSFLKSIFSVYFAKIADDRQQQTTCGEQNATTVVGPCARAVTSPYTAASCFCHSLRLSRIVLLLPRAQ